MILYILIAVFILGIVVFFHELGHFLLAKKNGIKVYTFSIGFGPKIWGKEYKGTEYRISAVPFGGYVAMAGEELEDRKGDPDEFASKTLWQRFQVVFAGPLMNFILAFVVIWLALIIGVNEPVRETELKIGWIEEESIAREAGMAVGDTITALNGKPVKNWKDFTNKLIFSKEEATITWLSQGKTMTADITLKRDPYTGMVLFGAAPGHPAVVRAVESESPAGKAGILPGDRIVSLDGEENARNSVGHNRIDIPLDRSENQRAGNRAVDQEIDIPFLSLAFGKLLKQLFFAFVNPGGALEGESFVGKANDNRRRLHRELFQPIRRHLHILFHSGRHLEELGIDQSVDEFLRLLDIRYPVERAVGPCRKCV